MSNAATARDWLDRFAALVAELDERPFSDFRALVGAGRARLDAAEAKRLLAESGGDTRRAARLAQGDGKTKSRKNARQVAKRAAAIGKNPQLADHLESGNLSTGQLDNIADAASQDENAAADPDLIDAIASASVDHGRRIANDWTNRRKQQSAIDDEHVRQRRLRTARRYNNKRNGLAGIALEGDDTTINQLWRTIRNRERALYRTDGGREVDNAAHERTWEQRHFDAAVAVLAGKTGVGARPAAVLNIPLGLLNGTDIAEAVGDGPIARQALAEAVRQAGLRICLTDIIGEPLAWGRLKRHGTPEQFIALVIRDGGCGICGADWQRCEIHHRIPWRSPARGETNLNDLVLLCPNDHHHVHDQHLTIIRNKRGDWTTRPATQEEIALRGVAEPDPDPQGAASRHPPSSMSTVPPAGRRPEHLGPTGTDPP